MKNLTDYLTNIKQADFNRIIICVGVGTKKQRTHIIQEKEYTNPNLCAGLLCDVILNKGINYIFIRKADDKQYMLIGEKGDEFTGIIRLNNKTNEMSFDSKYAWSLDTLEHHFNEFYDNASYLCHEKQYYWNLLLKKYRMKSIKEIVGEVTIFTQND
jgi:hypothetical protein